MATAAPGTVIVYHGHYLLALRNDLLAEAEILDLTTGELTPAEHPPAPGPAAERQGKLL